MAEYSLTRSRSSAIIRSVSLPPSPGPLTRTYSSPSLTLQKPYHLVYYTFSNPCHTYSKDYTTELDYWYDRYRFSQPYYSSYYPRRYFNSDYVLPRTHFYNPVYSRRHLRYLHDYGTPFYLSHFNDSAHKPYIRQSFYSPYRSRLYDAAYF
ncbi:unnamed protein product [Bursaphelenchus xylophilus]|uniref:(pine wood nematode) hypothetical protein n=1 Tax=Bursaphelenchus xylophilus TaxID=6326 RepID=A0A1I7STB7_BURXY|nr:unnamed protein product [Bursaphelenchus xylophilus]CAG9108587.1 unnamed protein product [Bursaphelenchus xylophilus]